MTSAQDEPKTGQYPCDKHEGDVLKREEDPRRWNSFMLGLNAEISVHVAQGGTTKTKIQFGSFRSLY